MIELNLIQTKLNAPKNQRNTFGNYNYRSCEDILEALKPLLKETGCTLTISDDVVLVGDRYYIKATATIANEKGDRISNTAYAREPEGKKGMDEAQVSGATSSYARKYALNGLFCIDDCKDADTMDNREETGKKSTQKASKTAGGTTPQTDYEIALNEAKSAKNEAEVQAVWAKWSHSYGTDSAFKNAIVTNPNRGK